MVLKQTSQTKWLQTSCTRISLTYFGFAAAFAAGIVLADAWKLITSEDILRRWTILSVFLVANTLLWYAARMNNRSNTYYKGLIYGQIILSLIVASFVVYTQRGLASRGVALFAIPIVVSSVLMARSALFATATLSTAAYILMVTRYYTMHFGENIKAELYGELAFYCATFFVLSAILGIVVRPKK